MKNKLHFQDPSETIVLSVTYQKFETEKCNIYCHIMVTEMKKLKVIRLELYFNKYLFTIKSHHKNKNYNKYVLA